MHAPPSRGGLAAVVVALAVVVTGSGLVACGGGEATPDGAVGPDATPPDAADPTVIETRTVAIGPITAAPGAEDTVCVVVDLGNDAPRMIRSIRTHLSSGTHHVIVTRVEGALSPEPTSCGAFAGGGIGADNDVLFIAEQSEAALAYPAGAGLPIGAHQPIHLEMHYINTQPSTTQDIDAAVEIDLAADDGVSLRPVELLFTGDLSLFLPAGQQVTVTSTFELPTGIDLFATTAHTHQWGRHASVELLAGADDPAPRLLHSSEDWAERPLSLFDPIHIEAGDLVRLTCAYDNQSGADVGFGLSANDEMCFLWAHYVAAAP
ncbi:MAG: hypothetical protein H6708_21400 [Kofleriaceae bacterium]|nr:hypothetical protein [Myxococcales bacterium]MCB9562969.1 hypothetical protein [Kofleriaceae bacterium]